MISLMLGASLAAAAPEIETRLLAGQEAVAQCDAAVAIEMITPEGRAHLTNGKGIGVATPMRIASNTKTATAATALRLVEMGKLDLDASIGSLLSPNLAEILESDGYDLDAIKLRQVMSHSGGIYSHAEDPRYGPKIFADPGHRWTRAEQVALATEWGDPLPIAGSFSYSDTGYLLVGDIIERITGKTLAAAARELLGFEALGLHETWWEIYEEPHAAMPARGHQFVGGDDVTDVDGSADAYGGGGLVMSMRDLATLFRAINEGRTFENAGTVETMRWQGEHENAAQYRLGLFANQNSDGSMTYFHSGFWGTLASHNTKSGLTLAGVVNEQSQFGCLAQTMIAMSSAGQ